MFSLEQNTYKNARLGDTDFTDAELRGYTFENCDLRGAMLSGALLEKCRFSACAFDKNAAFLRARSIFLA